MAMIKDSTIIYNLWYDPLDQKKYRYRAYALIICDIKK